jgi:homospermidine synthase
MTTKNHKDKVHIKFDQKLVIIGFGSIAQGVLPLILRHIDIEKKNIAIVSADGKGKSIAEKEGIPFHTEPLNPQNFKAVLEKYLDPKGGFVLNLSVDVSTIDLIRFCQERGALYLDACIEPWMGGYTDPTLTLSQRSNYGLRETALALKRSSTEKTTAVLAHGANPGLVSHFLKQALLTIAKDTGHSAGTPANKEGWARLMRELGVKTIHIAEYDSQVADKPKKLGRFENTWSVYGFHAEGLNQPSELSWGTHEKYFPGDAKHHDFGCGAGIYLQRSGAKTLMRTWTPSRGHFLGRLVTHNESISIGDYFTVREGDNVVFRPTVHYAYRPCDAAVLSLDESLGNNSELQPEQKILVDELVEGMDELGVLIMGHAKGAYWYGSQLSIEETRKLAPYQNATGLQVTAGVLGAMIWAMENPQAGIVEADDLDFERVMEIVRPYMGEMKGEYTDWTPLKGRDALFPGTEDIDKEDPWQFKNFRFV